MQEDLGNPLVDVFEGRAGARRDAHHEGISVSVVSRPNHVLIAAGVYNLQVHLLCVNNSTASINVEHCRNLLLIRELVEQIGLNEARLSNPGVA